jgi:hypothetical protein
MARDLFNDAVVMAGVDDYALLLTEDVFVTVYDRGTVNEAVIYANSTGATEIANPFEAVGGQIKFWANVGEYDIAINDVQNRIADQTIGWEALPAGTNSIPGSYLIDDSVIAEKLGLTGFVVDGVAGAEVGGYAQVVSGTVVFNNGDDYASNKFTAPANGLYLVVADTRPDPVAVGPYVTSFIFLGIKLNDVFIAQSQEHSDSIAASKSTSLARFLSLTAGNELKAFIDTDGWPLICTWGVIRIA